MYVALGFCTAGLIGLAILPAFYRRAARLTEEALRAVNPASYAEVRAAQDQERARYAVELTRVETRLGKERKKAARFHLEASQLRTEIEALKETHRDQVTALKAKLSAQEGEEHAVDMLSAEIKTLKEKLAESEKALAESWASASDAPNSAEEQAEKKPGDDTDWLPATDTMALATITGLEAEVATLKGRLAKYEPTVASEVEASLQDGAKSRLAELEAQLVDTESKYVSAQAEVTRLSLMLEAAEAPDTAADEKLNAELKKLTAQLSARQAELDETERRLERLSGQNRKLREDLEAAPALKELREEFQALSKRLSEAKTISVKRVTKRAPVRRKKTLDQPPAETPSKTDTPAAATPDRNGTRPKTGQRRKKPVAAPDRTAASAKTAAATTPAPAAKPVSPPAKSADIASAAEALVSRIVASSRNNASTDAGGKSAAPSGPEPADKSEPATARKTKTAKQKKKDVA